MGNTVQHIASGHVSKGLGIQAPKNEVQHTTVTVKVPDPVLEKEVAEAEEKLDDLRAAAETTSAESLAEKVEAQREVVLKSLKLTDPVEKEDSLETHVGVFGPVSVGKSKLISMLTMKEVNSGMGQTTDEYTPISKGLMTFWDSPGDNMDFKFHELDNLKFIRTLDMCVVCYSSNIDSVSHIVKVIHEINPTSLVLVRTKVDQHSSTDKYSIEEEHVRDVTEINKLIGVTVPLFFISSSNVEKKVTPVHDWFKLQIQLGLIL